MTHPSPDPVPDPVKIIADFAAALAVLAERAFTAARNGQAQAALLAAGEMQMLLRRRKEALQQALDTGRSKRIPPARRAAIRAAAGSALAPVQEVMGRFAADARARRARQDAIGAALSAATRAPAGVYGVASYRGGRMGVRLTGRTVRHTADVTA